MSLELDAIDTIATKAFEGYVVRKDLVRKFKGQYPVPTYVAEFLLGRYCASVDDEEMPKASRLSSVSSARRRSAPANMSCSRPAPRTRGR